MNRTDSVCAARSGMNLADQISEPFVTDGAWRQRLASSQIRRPRARERRFAPGDPRRHHLDCREPAFWLVVTLSIPLPGGDSQLGFQLVDASARREQLSALRRRQAGTQGPDGSDLGGASCIRWVADPQFPRDVLYAAPRRRKVANSVAKLCRTTASPNAVLPVL